MTTAQELKLDYFNIYDVANQEGGYVVGLQGQFDEQPERVRLTYLDFFANPASKNGEPFHDKNAHLTWYDLFDPAPDPVREVTYQDQFGKRQAYTGRACALLVPTWKIEKGTSYPEQLDHYKVYQVLRSVPVNTEVEVEDQFGKTTARIWDPLFFAVPVKKWYEGQTFGIHNETAHLAIYRIYPQTVERTIRSRDQFSQRILHVFRSVLLGSPCKKLEWKEA